ncbi:uncharacterized protein LOC133537430 [Nerophis ophidion]|uniref:uncharacterized protein LOC133537430 n=1 Tax=Nerophis ophidion TaxID=159077 RepID=UPI002ADF6C3A|nr:uncharacterized protein LOC133537430 [Nerophis ophidion]
MNASVDSQRAGGQVGVFVLQLAVQSEASLLPVVGQKWREGEDFAESGTGGHDVAEKRNVSFFISRSCKRVNVFCSSGGGGNACAFATNKSLRKVNPRTSKSSRPYRKAQYSGSIRITPSDNKTKRESKPLFYPQKAVWMKQTRGVRGRMEKNQFPSGQDGRQLRTDRQPSHQLLQFWKHHPRLLVSSGPSHGVVIFLVTGAAIFSVFSGQSHGVAILFVSGGQSHGAAIFLVYGGPYQGASAMLVTSTAFGFPAARTAIGRPHVSSSSAKRVPVPRSPDSPDAAPFNASPPPDCPSLAAGTQGLAIRCKLHPSLSRDI